MLEQYLQGNQGAEEYGSDWSHRKITFECLRQASGHLKANDQRGNKKASRKVKLFKNAFAHWYFWLSSYFSVYYITLMD